MYLISRSNTPVLICRDYHTALLLMVKLADEDHKRFDMAWEVYITINYWKVREVPYE